MSDYGFRPRHVAPVSLAHVAARCGISGPDADVDVSGITVDSRDVRPGDVFGAFAGYRVHGATFAAAACAAGAAAIITDAAGRDICRAAGLSVPVLVAEHTRAAVGEAAAAIYGDPSRDIVLIGVTGTNGKTTTTYFINAALASTHPHRGLLGTVELRVRDDSVESPRTTVESPVVHGLLARMVEADVSACVMEVSSHAAELERIAGAAFDVAVFTNLQWDHLDFHGTMDNYLAAKARLFEPHRCAHAVICVDDQWGVKLAQMVEVPVTTVATRADGPAADWTVTTADVGLDGVGSTFTLIGPDGHAHEAHSPLPGNVNVSNAAVAIVAAVSAGVDIDHAIAGVAAAPPIPGRMERVIERTDTQALAIVDYAHTPDALTLALEAVRPITPGTLVVVFGSDGDRDRGKRPVMGEIAATLADIIVLTDENPRSEDPAAIRAAIREGIERIRPDGRDVHEISPRSEALEYALRLARPGDTVIVTGKGHEPTQEVAGVFHRYNDRDAYLSALERIAAEGGAS